MFKSYFGKDAPNHNWAKSQLGNRLQKTWVSTRNSLRDGDEDLKPLALERSI